ncbi:MAG: FAD-binding oxidoreductase [Hyphomicrobiaceae bacterium]
MSKANLDRRIVITGGGIHGLGTAFHLALLGHTNVRVLDAGYFQSGASGRNGTLVRGGFASYEWTRLFAHSNRRWIELSRLLGENVMYTRRNYLIVAQTEKTQKLIEPAVPMHRELGLQSEIIGPGELARLAPCLDTRTVRMAVNLKDGGVAPHHAAMKGFLSAAKRIGVSVDYGKAVTAIERDGKRVTGVVAGGERIPADVVLLAAGAQSAAVAKLAGVAIDAFPQRIEAMALEPVRPILRPAIALPDRLCYLHQTARGEIVGGSEVPERPQDTLTTDLPVMSLTAKIYAEMFPAFSRLRILRHWAGMLLATPDWGPLTGRHPDLENLWVSTGWSYGIAGAAGTTELMALSISADEPHDIIRPFAVDRFRRGQPVAEGAIVLAPNASAHGTAA